VLGAQSPLGISLLPNATFGLNIAFSLLRVRKGSTILSSDQEHPAVEAWLDRFVAHGWKVERVCARNEGEFIDKVRAAAHSGTVGLIAISHVSYKDGRVLPVEGVGQIARELRIPYIVDGSQAVGHVRVDVQEIQPWVYAFSGHKWLFGPMGTGGIWSNGRVDEYGDEWSSWAAKVPEFKGGRFEGGTMNFALAAGLLEACKRAVKYQERDRKNLAEIRARVSDELSGSWRESTEWQGERSPGILAYPLSDEKPSWELAESLFRDRAVAVKPFRPPERPNAIRISFAPWSREDEIRRLIEALHKVQL
jgi:selenocysteine lyase/cysteine desulfurase